MVSLLLTKGKSGASVYDYHSARNMVQLIGSVATEPKSYNVEGENILRLVIKTRDRDDNYRAYYTYHVVVAPEMVAKRCTRQGIGLYDTLLIRGRLANHKDRTTGKVISNVQASEILSLRKDKPLTQEATPAEPPQDNDRVERYTEMLQDPEYQDGKKSGKIVSLLEKKVENEFFANGEPEFEYEDEDEYNPPF